MIKFMLQLPQKILSVLIKVLEYILVLPRKIVMFCLWIMIIIAVTYCYKIYDTSKVEKEAKQNANTTIKSIKIYAKKFYNKYKKW